MDYSHHHDAPRTAGSAAVSESWADSGRACLLGGHHSAEVIAIEKGGLSVGMVAYARVLGALDSDFAVVPAGTPTLDEIQGVFD